MKLRKTGNLSSVTGTKSSLLWSIIAVLFFSFSERGFAAEMGGAEVADIQQQRVVTGRIVDQTGEPIIGASIVEVGSTPLNGTITNFNGEYTLHLTTAAPALNITFIGFEEITVNVGNQSILNLVMQEYTAFLDELVVIGYGTARRGDLTGAIATIRVDDAMLAAAPRSIQDLLRANAPGLQVGMGSTAQGTGSLLVRGDSRLLTQAQRDEGRTSEPLIVLDGVIFQGDLSDINPMDVASINVLKDASSAAVFGARAAGGVVAITTHRGARGGRPRINVNSNIGVVELGPAANRLMSANEFLGFRGAAQVRSLGGWDAPFVQNNPQHFSDPRNLQGGMSQLEWFNQGRSVPATSVTDEELMRAWGGRLGMQPFDTENLVNWNLTNWEDLVFRGGFQQDHNVSVSNRTDYMSVFWSMGYTNREGFVVGDMFERFTSRLNLEMTITPFLRVGMHSGFVARNQSATPARWTATGHPLRALSPFAGNYIGRDDIPRYVVHNPTQLMGGLNPLYELDHISRRYWENRLDANLFAIVSLPFNIEYQVNFTPFYRWAERFNHEHTSSSVWADGTGQTRRQHWKEFSWMVDNILRWNETFGIHRFDVTLLANAERRQTWNTNMTGSQMIPGDQLGFHHMGAASQHTISSTDTYATADALMGRLSYSLLDRYMLTATIRRDGYSAFGMANPRGTFASFAAGWTFTSEPWADSFNHILDFGRLRLSWGENGNRDIGIYEALSNLTSGPYPYIDGSGGFFWTQQMIVNRMANHNLRWERTGAYNIGLDFSVMRRVRGSIEAYHSTTRDLLMRRTLPAMTGFTSVMANLGAIENRGLEIGLTYDVINNQNFAWTTSGNFSLNRRTLRRLYGDYVNVYDDLNNVIGRRELDDPSNGWFIGRDPNVIWQWENDGVWQAHEAEMARRWGAQPGDFRFVPQDGRIPGEGQVWALTDEDRIFMGHTTPRFRWTWRNEFTLYRDWSISAMMYSWWGHYGRFNDAANNNFALQWSSWSQPYWTPDNPINDFAAPGSSRTGVGANIYRNRSFIRLDNITVSYNVPRNIVQRMSVQNMRISASVRNPAVWAPHWTNWDPETGTAMPRTYNLNVNFTL